MPILDRKKKSKSKDGKASSGGGTKGGGSSSNNKNNASSSSNNNTKNIEYNPRWAGYTMIGLTSLINFCAVSNIAANTWRLNGAPSIALAWGILSFGFAFFVLALDRSQCFVEQFNYTKCWDGKFEGYTLLFVTAYWIVGVAIITQVDGVGYLTLNTYFSTWLILASCIYTLNEWSASKDILSIAELTGLSATLKSWYALLFSSLVVFGTAVNTVFHLYAPERYSDAALAIGVGMVSAAMSLVWICVHYKFIETVDHGGWIELGCASFLMILWIATTAVITQNQGLGSTIVGVGCNMEKLYQDSGNFSRGEQSISNCTILLLNNNETIVDSCMDFLNNEIPGSNLYVFVWLSLAMSVNIGLRWKAQQALQFAQAQNQRAIDASNERDNNDDDDDDNMVMTGNDDTRNNDNNDHDNNNIDLDEFEDATS